MPAPSRPRRRTSAPLLALLAASCTGGSAAESSAGSAEGEASGEVGDEEETETGCEPGPPPGPFGETCETAMRLGSGRHLGNLRERGEQRGGACGQGGPELFFEVEAPARADLIVDLKGAEFAPRLDWLTADCLPDLSYACSDLPTFVAYDQAPGSRLRFSIGLDGEDPALGAAPIPGQPDPLDFELELAWREVVGAGAPCAPSLASRCASSLVCDAESSTCVSLPGNACATPTSLELPDPAASPPQNTLSLTVDPAQGWGDVHAHSCGGTRRAEQVFRIPRAALEALPSTAAVEISQSAGPSPLTLAARGPGCAAEAELACVGDAQAQPLRIEASTWEAAPAGDLYLFVELPEGAAEAVGLTLAAVDP